MSSPATAPPGWYPDPRMPATQRFWNGEGWTEQVAPFEAKKDNTGALTGVGMLLAVVFPIGGMICAAILLGRDPKVGGILMAVSVAFTAVWYMGLNGGF